MTAAGIGLTEHLKKLCYIKIEYLLKIQQRILNNKHFFKFAKLVKIKAIMKNLEIRYILDILIYMYH